jgi:uncharacterized membrane protein
MKTSNKNTVKRISTVLFSALFILSAAFSTMAQTSEENIEIESWMTSPFSFEKTESDIEIEIESWMVDTDSFFEEEENLAIEEWMLTFANEFPYSSEISAQWLANLNNNPMEETQKVEDWMLDTNTFVTHQDIQLFANSISELDIEPWMTNSDSFMAPDYSKLTSLDQVVTNDDNEIKISVSLHY